MTKLFPTLLFILFCFTGLSQIKFEPGYIVNNEGTKQNCLIKNVNWKNNPTIIQYRFSPDTEIKKIGVNDILEFGISQKSKFVRAEVNIDKSTGLINSLSSKKEMEFVKETLFLKTLVEGSASLYYYENGNLVRFFYRVDNDTIKPLKYKKYLNQKNQVKENTEYRRQLYENLPISSVSIQKMNTIDYSYVDLLDYFSKYNTINDEEFNLYNKRDVEGGKLHLGIKLGILNRTLVSSGPNRIFAEVDFGNNIGFGAGLEIEFVFPFNQNKWSIFTQPKFTSYSADTEVVREGLSDTANADFQTVEFPLGVRHYFFLGEKSNVFVNGAFIFSLASDTELDLGVNRPNVLIGTSTGISAGAGYGIGGRFNLELRYDYFNDIARGVTERTVRYEGFSLIAGYRIF